MILALGARSIRGAMGTYTWVATLFTVGLALLLWWGPFHRQAPAFVVLSPNGSWTEATLDDGTQVWELRPGEATQVTPGSYRVTLFDAHGQARRHDLIVGKDDIVLGAELPRPPSGDPAPAR